MLGERRGRADLVVGDERLDEMVLDPHSLDLR
jgi:hypothetical protein